VCVCVCVCVRARARACVRACVRVKSVPVCVLLADGDDGATSEKRMRLVRSKSSSSSLSQMNDASNTGGAVVQVDCPTWGNKGLQLAKFGQLSQIL